MRVVSPDFQSCFSVDILNQNIAHSKLFRIEKDCTSICFLRIFHNITKCCIQFFLVLCTAKCKIHALFQCNFFGKIFHPHLHTGDFSTAKSTPPQSDDISLCYILHTSNFSFKVLKLSETSSLLLQTSWSSTCMKIHVLLSECSPQRVTVLSINSL
jgi:hypothetical protein